MTQVPDPSWKANPDIAADLSAADRYYDDYSIQDEDGREYDD